VNKTVIYARYSSHNQNEQSIEGQLKVCYEFAEKNDLTIVGEYIDRAISGTTDKRPEFLKMIEDGSKKQFQFVLVYQLDRFARNRYDSATYKAKLKKNNVRVISARENISDDPSGILVECFLEGMAEYYSAELSQKIKRGMDINAEKCLSTGGNVALGYYVDENKRFQIDQNTAPVVKRIFEMYVGGSSMAEIIRYLNSMQIKTSRGNEFNKNSIRKILTNKRYIGVYTYGDKEIKDGIPWIVSDALFEEAQMMMAKNKKAPARSKALSEYILTTKLFCGHCDYAMTGISGTGKSGKLYNYYQCVANRRGKCDKKTVPKDYIEDLVVGETKKLLTDENIDRIAREIVAFCEKEKDDSTLKRLQKLLKENAKATENLIKALEQGKITDVIMERIAQKKKERIELEQQIEKEKMQFPTITVTHVKFFLDRFKKGNVNDLKYRKALINAFVRKVVLYDKKMTILYNLQDSHSECPLDEKCSPKGKLVEARGVEPLSENLLTGLSPSAADVLGFPRRRPRPQGQRFGSFIESHPAQSLTGLVPRLF